MKFRCFLTVVSLYFIVLANGQTLPELPNIIPPSPNAETIQKYGDFPVSNYTGIPDITIPIYNIALKDITLPITLSYNASGIKVNEEASRIGLGWTLNAGGLISHTIRETNDFYSYNYLNSSTDNNLPDLKGISPTDYTIQHNYRFIEHNPDANSPNGPNPLFRYFRVVQDNYNKTKVPFSLPNNLDYTKFIVGVSSLSFNDTELGYDYEPDVFNYNFMGYSGKFIILRNGKVLKEKEDNLKIEYFLDSNILTTDVVSWKITTPDGAKYSFAAAEKVKFVDRPRMESFNSSFYLTKIETINGSVINLNYKKSNTLLTSFSNLQKSMDMGQAVQTNSGYYELVYLDNILFPGGSVRFDYVFDREDNEPEPRLKTIFIYDQLGNSIQKYELIHSYFNANFLGIDIPTLERLNLFSKNSHYYINSNQRSGYTKSWNEKRLKFTELKFWGNNNESNNYRFEYNESNLPTKLSSSIDHWGYFNGALNKILIPSVVQMEGIRNGYPKYSFGGFDANREADASFNGAFILEKIKYPTGGETRFIFEANRFHTNDFENDPYKRYLMYRRENNSFEELQERGLNNMPHQIKYLNIENGSTLVKISLEFVLDKYLYIGDPFLEISIKKDINDPNPVFKKVLNGSNFLPIPTLLENKQMTYNSEDIWLPSGQYIFMVGGSLFKQMKSIKANASVIKSPEDYLKKNFLGIGGGLRVKMINSYDFTGKWILGKSFKYTSDYFKYDYYSPGFSSGKLMFYPRYRNNRGYETSEGGRGSGFSVGYSQVYVTDVDPIGNIKNGVTLYQYINKPDQNLHYKFDFGEYDFAKDINPAGIDGFRYQENGTLLRDSVFIEEGQKLNLVKTSEYINNVIQDDIIWAINRSRFTSPSLSYMIPNGDVYTHENNTEVTRLNFMYPAIRPIWVRLEQKIETNMENNIPIKSITNYTYNPIYRYLTKEEQMSSADLLKTIEYKYPPDFTNNVNINKLTADNRINIPIELKRTFNNKVSQIINEYNLFNNIPQISLIKLNTGINKTIEPKIFYNLYDIYGNPQEIKKQEEPVTTYLWGYGGQYPIAEIKNATYSEVETVLTKATIDALNLLTVTETTIKNAGDKLRNDLPNAMVTSYTYQPLVGMKSKTDARGVAEYYEYDGMQRLKAVLDQVKNVTSSMDYHYRPN